MEEPVINERERRHAAELTKGRIPIREWWSKDNALLTFAFNSSSATVPEGERFIVRAVDEARTRVRDTELSAQATILVHEEMAHARMHDAYNRYLDMQGLPATKHVAETKALLGFFERIFTLRMRLVVCTIIEHFTAVYSKQVVEVGVLEGEDTDERMDRVWSWHCIEEMEHRATAIDLYRALGGGYFMRAGIGAIVSVAFFVAHVRCIVDFMTAKRVLWKWRTWTRGMPYLVGRKGIYRLVLKYWLSYFRPGFHPTDIPIENRYRTQLHHYHIEDELVGYFGLPGHDGAMEPVRKRSAGGIVIGDGGTIALVRNARGPAWTFPKGHVDEYEMDEEAARREIREETGLSDVELLDDLGIYERYRIGPNGDDEDRSELKEIHLYLFGAMPHAALRPSLEIEEAVWVPFREVADRLTHPKDRAFFASVFDRVREGIQRD